MSPGLVYQLSQSNDRNTYDKSSESMKRESIREFRIIVANVIKKIATSNNLSSVHLNFITDDEALDIAGPLPIPSFNKEQDNKDSRDKSDDNNNEGKNANSGLDRVKTVLNRFAPREKNDFFRRASIQYHWKNQNRNNNDLPYESFEEYLSCFKSKKRISIKRERRRVLTEQNVRIDAIRGRDILLYPGLVERMFEIYKSTVDKMLFGRQYLTLDFFQKLVKSDFVDNLLFMCARFRTTDNDDRLKAEDVFAGTFNVIKDKVFYGRYWGCLPNFDLKNLHFEVCYWSAIEYCIDNKFKCFEPGAGGGDYKWARGFDPVLIHSAHFISQPAFRKAVRDYVQIDSERNVAISDLLNERSAVVKQIQSAQDNDGKS